jgi:hypothetical protein
LENQVLAQARLIFALIFLPSLITASAQTLIPTQVNIGSQGVTFGVAQGVIINCAVGSTTGTATLTGTVQFLANGIPVDSPYKLTPGPGFVNFIATLPISVPGNYSITAAYSGDATYAPSTSAYNWPAIVVQNPPTLLVDFTSPSLNFASGATTGNSVLVSLDPVNAFHGSAQYSCTVTLNSGSAAPAFPATCALLSALPPNGNPGFLVSITTAVPRQVQEASIPNNTLSGGAMLCALFLFMPRSRRLGQLRAIVVALAFSGVLACLSGCGGSSPTLPTPATTTESSAGNYTITIQGQAYDQLTGDITIFSGSIPLTVT